MKRPASARPPRRTSASPSRTVPRRLVSTELPGGGGRRSEGRHERRDPIQDVVEHGPKRMPEPRIRHELGVREQADRDSQELDPRERVGLAGEQQDRAVDRRPVGATAPPRARARRAGGAGS